jgi:hypothetical protein
MFMISVVTHFQIPPTFFVNVVLKEKESNIKVVDYFRPNKKKEVFFRYSYFFQLSFISMHTGNANA